MNFLAHLHLGRHTDRFLLGSLLGDFVRGRIEDNSDIDPEVRRGIIVHRKIDAWTDQHPVWQRSRARLTSGRRRFAGIIIDVFYDHFLSRHWDRFCDIERAAFIGGCYAALERQRDEVDPTVRPIFTRMAEEDWLGSYHDLDGIAETLRRISRRSPRVSPIAGSDAELREHEADYEADFLEFYPDAMEFADGEIEGLFRLTGS